MGTMKKGIGDTVPEKATRLVCIDLLKVVAAVVVFFFHCNIHLGVQFTGLTPFISQGAIMMSLFLGNKEQTNQGGVFIHEAHDYRRGRIYWEQFHLL